jgi:hypothetical protein
MHDPTVRAWVVQLSESGFTFGPLPGLFGVDGVYACRIGAGHVEAVVLRTADTADAVRVSDHFDAGNPLAAPDVLWSGSGTVSQVVDALLNLPSPWPREG